jgi:phospholipid transport system substrate-binding protein
MKMEVPTDPLNDLERADRAIEGLLGRKVPDWSPEADAIAWDVDTILAGLLDYEQIARGSLGTDWDRMTADQRSAFLGALSGLTNRAFVSAIARPDVRLHFESETVLGPKASVMVTARVRNNASEADQQIEYRLALKRGRWLIYDVLVGGSGLVESYHVQFARLIQRDGPAGLIDRMQHRLEASRRY